ncbi:MAG: extracellular solute-binding protein [Oscillospiraceae bacterium]|jgi:maltose-binding protein MalE|nr:extracellular solute-binding protein [Oscillospiraceae bacterium]
MIIYKKLIASLLCAATLAGLAGCGATPQTPQESVAMGRYIEEAWTTPEISERWYLSGAHLRPDGKFAVVAQMNAEPYEIKYYTTADGTQWAEETPPWLSTLNGVAGYFRSIDFNSKGEGLVCYLGTKLDGSGEELDRIAMISADGSITDSAIGEDGDPWDAVSHMGSDGTIYAEDIEETEDATEETTSDTAIVESALPEEEPVPSIMPLFPRDVLMGEDGMVYLTTQFSGSGKFDPITGELTASYLTEAHSFTLAGGEAVQLLTMGSAERAGHTVDANSLFFSDAATGMLNRTLPSENLQIDNGAAIAGGEDGAVYIANKSGLSRVAPGGDTWEQILDGNMCSLSVPSMNPYQIFPHGEDEFLLVFYTDQSLRFFNYTYSEDTPALPDSELTVFTMLDNRTISQAVGAFRQQHPNTLVNIRTSRDIAEAGNGDDVRAALNTEILAGKGPDVFVLGDLPLDSYIEKGVLADLSDVVDSLLETDSILPAVTEAYANKNGIFAIPARVNLPTLWGDEDAVAAVTDLDSLLAYAKSHPDERLFGNMTPEHLLYQLAPGTLNSLLKDGAVDIAAVEKLLATVMALSETADEPHFYSYFGTEEYLSQIKGYAYTFSDGGYVAATNTPADPEDYFAVANNRAALMLQFLNGFESVMQSNGVINKRLGGMTWDSTGEGDWVSDVPDDMVDKVFRLFPDSGLYEPSCVVGVNAASTQPELAKAFIEAVLSVETQNTDLGDGFPVNREAIAIGADAYQSHYTSHSYSTATEGDPSFPADEMRLEYAWPSKPMLQAVADRLSEIKTPMMQGYPLPIKYAMQECLPLALDKIINGESTAGEAAAWLAGELSLALEE